MSIIPASRLSSSDLALLGNNLDEPKQRPYQRRPSQPRYRGELAAVNRSLATIGERVGRLLTPRPQHAKSDA
jgi:hypothetical protein